MARRKDYPKVSDNKLHELGKRWLAGEFLYELGPEAGLGRAQLRERLIRLGYRLSEEQVNKRKGRMVSVDDKFSGDLSDEVYEDARVREMEKCEDAWARVLNGKKFEDVQVTDMVGRLPFPETIVPRNSTLGDLDMLEDAT